MKDAFLSRFTPSLMSQETLEEIFIQRERLADDLVTRVHDSATTRAKHHTLLIGSRGIGKTHLVALVYHRVKALEDIRDLLCIAWLREEEWGITSFMDLLLRILRALNEEHPDADLEQEMEAIFTLSSQQEAESAAAELLASFVGDRTLFVLLENLDDVFSGIGQEGQQQLRAYLQNHPFSTLLATSQSLFNGVSVKTSPFYGFFNVHHLKAFSLEEATQLLTTIARLEGDAELADYILTPEGRARIRAVHHLAGGNPRIYVILSQFLTRASLDELVVPFMSMLDDLTPYYQARMQWLSPQQRKIVEFLIDRRHAVPVKDIAQRTFATHQTISGQLRTLRDMGYVRAISMGRESLYELREPLMRMCVEVKKHRGKPVRLFVDFLRLWYTQTELEQRLERFSLKDALEREYMMQALHSNGSEPGSPLLDACLRDYNAYFEADDFNRALEAAEEMVAIRGTAEDWSRQGYVFDLQRRYEDALVSFDKCVELDSEYAWAWWRRGHTLRALARYEEAQASFKRAVELDPDDAWLWWAHGLAAMDLSRPQEALASFERVIELDRETGLGWKSKGDALMALGRVEEALISYKMAVSMEPEYAWSWCGQGEALHALDRFGDALASFEQAIKINPENAWAWWRLGLAFGELDRHEEALASFEKAVALEPVSSLVLLDRCVALARLGRWDESFAALDDMLTAFIPSAPAWFAVSGDEFVEWLLVDSPGPEVMKTRVEALVDIFARHGMLSILAVWFQRSFRDLDGIEEAAIREWRDAWQGATGDHDEFKLPLAFLDALIRYRATEDPRILLEFPVEERELLRHLLEIEELGEE